MGEKDVSTFKQLTSEFSEYNLLVNLWLPVSDMTKDDDKNKVTLVYTLPSYSYNFSPRHFSHLEKRGLM